MTHRIDHLLFVYWCPRCHRHYCRELAEAQSCGCGLMKATHVATIDPRLVLPEILNRKASLSDLHHGTARHTREVNFIHEG